MAFSAKAIANQLLDLARHRQIALSPMKLQKLVYFAHGWHLGLTGEPLIDEPIEAWQYGPVVESLYHEFKQYGNQPIQGYATVLLNWQLVTPVLDDGERDRLTPFLNQVLDIYGQYSAIQLSNMTHEAESPWDKVWKKTQGELRHVDIPNKEIEEYFKAKLPAAKTQ